MKSQIIKHVDVRAQVQKYYTKVATQGQERGCLPSCCGSLKKLDAISLAQSVGYSVDNTDSAPDGANLGLGCGNPHAIALLTPGETVLDLGCGAGFDAFLAAKVVGPMGLVIGVDMTSEMISKARHNKTKGDYDNVEFRLGEIENLPVANDSVDVIISNCVINLSPDKQQVFREAYRVLKPGGRLAISDILATAPLPESIRADLELYTVCVGGASAPEEIQALLATAGFTNIRIQMKSHSREVIREWFPSQEIEDSIVSATIVAVK